MLWVKWMKPDGVAVYRAWDILALGTQSPISLAIPAWTQDQGGFNVQIEATVQNVTSERLSVVYRTQTCPKSLGGTYGGGGGPIPPCGLVVDSAAVQVGPGETVLLPIWQLRMWSEPIREHNWIVDDGALDITRLGTYYNIAFPWQNWAYRQDDWFIDMLVPPQVNFTFTPQEIVVGQTVASFSVTGVDNDLIDISLYRADTNAKVATIARANAVGGSLTGTVTLQAISFTGQAYVQAVDVTTETNIGRVPVLIVASGGYSITVHVRNPVGSPVSGATVNLA